MSPIAIGQYTDPGHADLTDHPEQNVHTEVTAVADLFAPFGRDCVAWDTAMADRTGDQVTARLN